MGKVEYATVQAGGIIRVDLPEGTRVEIRSETEPVAPTSLIARRLEIFREADAWRRERPHEVRTLEEIERDVRIERESWD